MVVILRLLELPEVQAAAAELIPLPVEQESLARAMRADQAVPAFGNLAAAEALVPLAPLVDLVPVTEGQAESVQIISSPDLVSTTQAAEAEEVTQEVVLERQLAAWAVGEPVLVSVMEPVRLARLTLEEAAEAEATVLVSVVLAVQV